MKDEILIHIPHSSLKCPNIFYGRTLFSKEEIEKLHIFISDYLVDKFIPNNSSNIIKFNFSRLFCDVERFKDDNLEVMSKYGMGAIYERDHRNNVFIKLDDNYKKNVIKNYYDKHHQLLNDKVTNILKRCNKCYIIDLHSFSDQFVNQVLNLKNTPDICIGYNKKFCDLNLVTKTLEHFKKYGYEVKTNYPYSGSLIPNKYYNSNESNLYSIMIEINKRIYLDDNILINNNKYSKLKKCIDACYELLNNYLEQL